MRGSQSLRIQLAPLPPAIASRTLSRSAPAFAASARPSAIPIAVTEPIRLFASFAISPCPIGPTCTGRPSVSSTGRQRAYAVSEPPAMIARSPSRAATGPPLTGVSSTSMPRGASRRARSCAVAGFTVLSSSSAARSRSPASSPVSPPSAVSISGVSGSTTSTTSLRSRELAPASRSRRRRRRRGRRRARDGGRKRRPRRPRSPAAWRSRLPARRRRAPRSARRRSQRPNAFEPARGIGAALAGVQRERPVGVDVEHEAARHDDRGACELDDRGAGQRARRPAASGRPRPASARARARPDPTPAARRAARRPRRRLGHRRSPASPFGPTR